MELSLQEPFHCSKRLMDIKATLVFLTYTASLQSLLCMDLLFMHPRYPIKRTHSLEHEKITKKIKKEPISAIQGSLITVTRIAEGSGEQIDDAVLHSGGRW